MLKPAQIAAAYLPLGAAKARLRPLKILVTAVLAGLFVGVAAVGANTLASSIAHPGLARLAAALVFPTALAMILLAGGELFTGNNLLVIPLLERQISLGLLLRNWLWVYVGNFGGALLIVGLVGVAEQWGGFDNGVAVYTIKAAAAKCALSPAAAFFLGIGCNFLVCTACWMSYGSSTAVGKIAALYLPVMMFVLCGFEHSIANMYYVPAGLAALRNPVYLAAALASGVDVSGLTWGNFLLANLLPVTLGNIVGGAVLLGGTNWFLHLKK